MFSEFSLEVGIAQYSRQVSKVPKPEVPSLYSIISSAVDSSEGGTDAEGFSGLQIDDQLETRRLFDRQVTGLCAF
jgi:hypothetical protein